MAHIVVAAAEAVGRQHPLHVLAQGGRFAGQVDPAQGLDQMGGQGNAWLPIKRVMQQMPQEAEHPHEHRAVRQGRPAAPVPAEEIVGCRGWLQRPRGSPSVQKALLVQPEQIPLQCVHVAVAGTMQPGEQNGGPFGHGTLWQRVADRFQFGTGGHITGAEAREAAEQLQQMQQPLQIE